jgi:glyoxylase-like metal-dependent hydrolase (beta-lactamase superfamily II)
MQEILPGLYHWTAVHPHIRSEVSCYWLHAPGVAIDPLEPPDVGLDWFATAGKPPTAVLLSNRHHSRHAARFAQRFSCPVLCNHTGLHEFAGGELAVQGFDVGQRLPGDVLACAMDAICPDDTALYLPAQRALLFADGVVRGGPIGGDGPLGWVPDTFMDDPPGTKAALLAACQRLLADPQLDFQHLLLAHGGPVLHEGRALLRDLVNDGGRTAFEM